MERSWVRVQDIPKTLNMLLKTPQPVLVIMSLSKGNDSQNGHPDKGGLIQRAGCLIR